MSQTPEEMEAVLGMSTSPPPRSWRGGLAEIDSDGEPPPGRDSDKGGDDDGGSAGGDDGGGLDGPRRGRTFMTKALADTDRARVDAAANLITRFKNRRSKQMLYNPCQQHNSFILFFDMRRGRLRVGSLFRYRS